MPIAVACTRCGRCAELPDAFTGGEARCGCGAWSALSPRPIAERRARELWRAAKPLDERELRSGRAVGHVIAGWRLVRFARDDYFGPRYDGEPADDRARRLAAGMPVAVQLLIGTWGAKVTTSGANVDARALEQPLQQCTDDTARASGTGARAIVRAFDAAVTADPIGYAAIERVDGRPLADVIATGPMPLERVVQIGIDVATALAAAHANGARHGALSAASVLVEHASGRVRVAGFGLGRLHRFCIEHTDPEFAGPSEFHLEHVAPGEDHGDPGWPDLYALGWLLFECARGERAPRVYDRWKSVADLTSLGKRAARLNELVKRLTTPGGPSPNASAVLDALGKALR